MRRGHGRPAAALLGAVLGAVLTLAGCADDGDDDQDGSAAPTTTAVPPPTRTPAPVEFRRVITSSHLDGGCRADKATCDAWAGFGCPGEPQRLGDELMACGAGDDADQPYLLAAAEIVGGVESARPAHREGAAQWEVEIELDPAATKAFALLTADLVPHSDQLAIVLDEVVVAAPAVQTRITDGRVRLAGDYTEAEAEALAGRLSS